MGAVGTAVGALALGLVTSLTLVPSAQAYEDGQTWNDYITSDLPDYILTPTPFTVTVDGPLPVCSMTYNGTTLTAAPWAFTAPMSSVEGGVRVTLCDGTQDQVRVWTQPAFEIGSPYLAPGKVTKHGTVFGVAVGNRLSEPAKITVLNARGRVLATGTAKANSPIGWFVRPNLTFNAGRLKGTTTFTVRVTAVDGRSFDSKVVAPVGWTMPLGRPFDTNCSTIPWYYNRKGQPSGSRSITKDIVAGLAKLSGQTGLRFVRTQNPEESSLTFSWDNLGVHGPSGIGGGGTSGKGTVVFNTKDDWPLDRFAGSGRVNGYMPGRVWLVVHEVMHTLGMGHISDRTQVMNPLVYVTTFGKGDLDGLNTLYPKSACRA